ncbi:MAG: hypothetical protein HYV02_02130 [Deltaproteobacteria bacterium]|nr:hypothetical protein [Deltaproteobacteria bacterium]
MRRAAETIQVGQGLLQTSASGGAGTLTVVVSGQSRQGRALCTKKVEEILRKAGVTYFQTKEIAGPWQVRFGGE